MRAALPLAAAALLGVARATNYRWVRGGKCDSVTAFSWEVPECWTPAGAWSGAFQPNDTLTFDFPNSTINIDTLRDDVNYKADAFYAPNLIISTGTTLRIFQGSLQLDGVAKIHGTLEVAGEAPGMWVQAVETTDQYRLREDTKSRALGLRDCAYTPTGFTPRLCGPGTLSVQDGGVLNLHGKYASVFTHVQVQKGGTYHISAEAHPWGLIENWGSVTSRPPSTVYWHGMMDNKAGGIFSQEGLAYFDEYTHEEANPAPEKFNQEAFRNAGKMMITGNLVSTHYYYSFKENPGGKPISGTYKPSFVNAQGGTMVLSGELHLADTFENHGTWDQSGTTRFNGFINTGTFNLSGYIEIATIVNSGTFFSNGEVGCHAFVNNGTVDLSGRHHQGGPLNNTGNWSTRAYTQRWDVTYNTGRLVSDEKPWSGGEFRNYNYMRVVHPDFHTLINLGQAELSPGGSSITNNGSILMLSTNGVNKQTGHVVNNAGARILFAKGGGTELRELTTAGDVATDGHQLWVSSLTCVNCNIYLSGGAELLVRNSHQQGPVPRGLLASLPPSRGTPKVCSGGVCTNDPCPYTISPFSPSRENVTGPCTFSQNGTGPLPGVMAYGVCYACTPTNRSGLLGDRGVIERLIRDARHQDDDGGWDGPAPNAAELSHRRHHFEGGTVRSDGTGSLIIAGSVHLFGRKAMQVHNTRVHTVVEFGHPALLGGGTLALRHRSVLRLGVYAVLDGGGSINAGPGTAVVVDGHASVSARNHSLRIAPQASVRVDGHLHVGARSTLRSCGTNVGSGGVTFDDPASSAVTCATSSAASAQCLSDCQTDADCSAAGSCTWCSKAHGGTAAVGSCTEPRAACKSSADCSYQGDCIAGLCANCHKYGLTHTGPDCSKLVVDSPAALLDNWRDVATGKAYSGDVVGAERIHQYSLFLATHKPNVCPNLGGPDDMIVNDAPAYSWDGNMKVYPGLLLKQAQLLTPMLSDASQPNVTVFFDYSWPRTDGCSFNFSQCIGTCPGGGQCGFTSGADCGCPARCAPRSSSAAQCGTRIAVSPTVRDLGDCGPHDSCFCRRDGEQKVIGSKGCPSSPRAVQTDNNTVLLFYNMGDGKNIGLAQGPLNGPWNVVKEPLFSGTDAVQDPFVYKNNYGWHMMLSGVAQKNIRAAFSEDGKSWTLLPKPLIDVKPAVSGSFFTQVSRPRVYTQGPHGDWMHHLTFDSRCYLVMVDGKTSDNSAVRPWYWSMCVDDTHWA